MNSAGIDTSALLTMLGLIAAVWALVPSTARLSFRLSLSWLDWVVVWGMVLVIHGFFFEPVIRALGFPNLGPWRLGFEKSSFQYLLFLLIALFVYWRSRRTKLTRRNLNLFDDLTTSLLLAGKFDELGELLQRHLKSALALSKQRSLRSRIANWIKPKQLGAKFFLTLAGAMEIQQNSSSKFLGPQYLRFRQRLATLIEPMDTVSRRASIVVKRLLSSRGLVAHLANVRPYLCMEVMEQAVLIEDSFQDEFFNALLGNEGSIFYSELRNSENMGQAGNRLWLPEENRLLRFYFTDVGVAARLGVYRSVGEAILARIDADDLLEKKLNGRLLTFQEVGKYHDPIYTGLWFFRVMVLEGLHQRSDDHLWLHYMPHFASRLVDRARAVRADDENYEFPTPLAYLLYQVVDSTVVWVRDAETLTNPGEVLNRAQREGNHVYISFEAAEAIGPVMKSILLSPCVPSRLKVELFSVVLGTLRDLEHHEHLAPLARAMRKSLIEPYGFREKYDYLHTLRSYFIEQDHVLRGYLQLFVQDLDEALVAAAQA